MPIRLYSIPLSPPGHSARLALEYKGLDFELVDLLGGFHPPMLRALGFKGVTVPALKLEDGTRVQGSLAIMQALDPLPGPSLYPSDPAARAAVEEAERWGEGVLQDIPRRIIRWTLKAQLSQRQWFADVATPLPLPKLMGVALTPIVPLFVKQAGAYDAPVRQDLDDLPGHLDHIDALIADGVIGGQTPNAADFQIAGALATLTAFTDLQPLFAGRPCRDLALGFVPDYPQIPAALPPQWLATA